MSYPWDFETPTLELTSDFPEKLGMGTCQSHDIFFVSGMNIMKIQKCLASKRVTIPGNLRLCY